jgi:hypothetical protein
VEGAGRYRRSSLRGGLMAIAEADRSKIVQSIRAYIARERISREEFAQRAKLGKSTVDKLVVGLFSEKTIFQIESQLRINLRDATIAPELAAEDLGRYSRDETAKYVGQYVFARPAFQEDGHIHAFGMEIVWDSAAKALLVREMASGKKVPPQFGKIHIPRNSMHIFILSNEGGWVKQLILSQIDVYQKMKGIMLTMGNVFANLYRPVAMPVIMNKYETISKEMIGKINPKSPAYAQFKQDLVAVEQDQFAKWIRLGPV